MNEFIWPVRVYYEDTDSGGVVYHANYLKFIERARTEWLRSLHIEQNVLVHEYGMIFVIHSLSINYLKPAFFNEALLVKTTIQKLNRASIIFEQLVVKNIDGTRKQTRLAKAIVKVVSLDLAHRKPVPLPKPVYDRFSNEIL